MTERLWHLARLRTSEEREFLRPGLCDGLLINANQLENNPEGTTGHLQTTGLPYLVDPVLSRLQTPAWWRNKRGELKRNYARLASRYSAGTDIRMAEEPLVDAVRSDAEWRRLAGNVVEYERGRLCEQLDLFNPDGVRPQGVIAPSLVAWTQAEDRANRLLAEASAEAAGEPLFVQVVVPLGRLAQPRELNQALAAVPTDGVLGYLIWTPGVLEETLLQDEDVFGGLFGAITRLAEGGKPVVHVQGSYVTCALRRFGIAGVIHHLGWVDKGEPAEEQRGAIRSCRTYAPAVRHSILFHEAESLGRRLNEPDYLARYCDCAFCAAVFTKGEHPLDLLLEDRVVVPGQRRRMPTSRATTANKWHYIHARRQEVQAFGSEPALDIVTRDLERAAGLTGYPPTELEQLYARLRSA